MKIVLLHTKDAVEPGPEDPVLAQVEGALRAEGHETARVMADTDVEPLVTALKAAAPDLVFNMCESFGGRSALESNVAGLLNLLGLRYTGSSPAGLLIAGDKTLAKMVLGFHGIRTAEFGSVWRGAVEWAGDLQFPLIVKPPQEDASLGITQKSIVHDVKELLDKIGELQSAYQTPVLVEQFIEGREFYIGVLGNASAKALPPIEMDFSQLPAGMAKIASYEAKWGEGGAGTGVEFAGTRSVFPEGLDEALVAGMQKVAVEAFHACRLRDYARIDLRVTPKGEIYVIEVNPNCYLEAESEFARAAGKEGIAYAELIPRIVELASARYAR